MGQVLLLAKTLYLQYRLQQSTKLKMEQMQNHYFCYLFIKQQKQAILALIFGVGALVLGLIAARQCYQILSLLRTLDKIVRFIYIGIFLWAIMFIVKVIFGEIVYLKYKNQQDLELQLSNLSKWQFVIEVICGFIVETILILIPFNWVDKILVIFQNFYIESLSQSDNSVLSKKSTKNPLFFEITLRRFLKWYLLIRPFVFVGILIPVVVFSGQNTNESTMGKLILILSIVQAVVVLTVLGLGLHRISTNQKLQELIDEDQIDTMKNQYLILIICSLLRLGLDIAFLAIHFENMTITQCKAKVDRASDWIWLRFVDLFVEATFTYFLPIIITLRLYKMDTSKFKPSDSLLASNDNEGSGNFN